MAAVAILVLARLLLMALGPLADTTEARYGELARQTVAAGYWLMPHMDAQTPFFAKPPLSTWSSAVGMVLFGVNEFGARLPALLFSALSAWLCSAFAALYGVHRRWLVVAVLAATPVFFVSAGAVMTDAVQMLLVCAAQYFAWQVIVAEKRSAVRWQRWGFWACIGLGAIAKGLATWALIGMPLLVYALLPGRRLALLLRLWDWAGVALAAALFLPWYIAAERSYPGFINYFIVGEHFSRFLVPGWTGDRYGTAHRQPFGAIWVFWIAGVLPWIWLFAARVTRLLRTREAAPIEAYLWCATLVPLVFFTFSRNIIGTYTLTAVPPFAILVAGWLNQMSPRGLRKAGVMLAGFAMIALLAVPLLLKQQDGHSDRGLLRAYAAHAAPGTPLIYLTPPAFSSAFYGHDVVHYQDKGGLPTAPAFVVVDSADIARVRGNIIYRGPQRTLIEVAP